jgi:hypothetical protein
MLLIGLETAPALDSAGSWCLLTAFIFHTKFADQNMATMGAFCCSRNQARRVSVSLVCLPHANPWIVTRSTNAITFQKSDSAHAKFEAIFARYSSIGTALRSAIKSLPICPTSVLNFWLSPVARA